MLCNRIDNLSLALRTEIKFPPFDGTKESVKAIEEYARDCCFRCLASGISFPDHVVAEYKSIPIEQVRSLQCFFEDYITVEEKKILSLTKSSVNVKYYFNFLEVIADCQNWLAHKSGGKKL